MHAGWQLQLPEQAFGVEVILAGLVNDTNQLVRVSLRVREDSRRRHDPIAQTGGWLTQVVRGYFNDHAAPENLQRRSQRCRWTWERFAALPDRYLPAPRILHPWLLARFCAKYPR